MLFYKAWLETRSRFLISLAGIVGLCSFTVYHGNMQAIPGTNIGYYRFVLHSTHMTHSVLWVLATTLLMMGGLLREKAVGTIGFTLSLPVSRSRLMRARACMGAAQALALALIPSIISHVIARTTGKAATIDQAFFHLILLVGGGFVLFGLAILTSSLIEGEYTAPIVSLGIILTMVFLSGNKVSGSRSGSWSFAEYNPVVLIGGREYVDRQTWLLVGPIPWIPLAVSFCAGLALIALSVKAVRAREF